MTQVSWMPRGRISFCKNQWPQFPDVEAVAGLYRLALDDGYWYIGQARNLRHRLYEYRRPTAGVVVEHSIHLALLRAGGASVETFISSELSDTRLRCDLEKKEIDASRQAGKKLLNGGRDADEYRLKLDIEYHSAEVEKLRAQLKAISIRS